jgi:hypothetical protein
MFSSQKTHLLSPRAILLGLVACSGGLSAAWGCAGGDAPPPDGAGGAGGAPSQDKASTSAGPSSSSGSGAQSASSSSGGFVDLFARFPDTSASISVLADQLPSGMTAGQQQFVAARFVGTQKLTLDLSKPLRAINASFLVLHYHLAMWQSAPAVPFILDGKSWGNDYGTVNQHETWFWHNTANQRVASVVDKKLLMNIAEPGFQGYWIDSLTQQVQAGAYDGIFLDSASPALLQGEVGSVDARLAGTGARDNPIPELGNKTFIQAWEEWISVLDAALASRGIPLIPNMSAFVTSWDTTNYALTAGVFSEGFADPSFVEGDWKASTNTLLALAAKGKIMILQNYLGSAGDVERRLYYLGNYLLVKGARTYLDYFAAGPLEWYPEWGLELGLAQKTAATVDELAAGGVYRRDFAKGVVLVNPSSSPVSVALGETLSRVDPQGGGAINDAGAEPGSISVAAVTSVEVPAKGARILLR